MAQSDSLDDGHGHGSPWSSTSFQIATLFLIILAVVGIAIAIFHHGSHHARAGNPPATSHAGSRARDHNRVRPLPAAFARYRPGTNRCRQRAIRKARRGNPLGR